MSVAKRQRAMLARMFRERFAGRVIDRARAEYALQQAFRDVRITQITDAEFVRRADEALKPYLRIEVERG